MSDPILSLDNAIHECMFRISPGKIEQLLEFVDEHGLAIVFTRDRGFAIRVNLDTHEIKLPISALNYIWCATYMFYSLYQAYVEAQESGVRALDTATTRASVGIDLFNWAEGALTSGDTEWPADLPKPSLQHEQGDAVHFTNEVFLCALAWILHHERAHVELEHSSAHKSITLRQESEADESATNWILSDCGSDEERQKRAFGIATATLAMALLDDVRAPQPQVTTHPPAPERLFVNLDTAALPPDNIVFSYCLVILQFCIAQYTSAPPVDEDRGTFAEVYEEFLMAYATRHRDGIGR